MTDASGLGVVRGRTEAVRVTVIEGGRPSRRRDRLAGEEPLEIRVSGPGQEPASLAVTMRTPGHDFELAAGFLYTEGLVASGLEIVSIRYCDPPAGEPQRYNVVTVQTRGPFAVDVVRRNFYATSSCGICGKASIDQIEVRCAVVGAGPTVGSGTLERLPEALRGAQRLFDETGAMHATGLFDADGTLLAAREDVGRHNAMDKLVGAELLAGRVPLGDRIALVSGRASFELVQKAAVAGIPILCAVSAPTSLAVDAARRLGVTLVGFLRPGRMNVYSHPERLRVATAAASA